MTCCLLSRCDPFALNPNRFSGACSFFAVSTSLADDAAFFAPHCLCSGTRGSCRTAIFAARITLLSQTGCDRNLTLTLALFFALCQHLSADHHPVSTGTTPCCDDDHPSPHLASPTTHSPPCPSRTRRSLAVTLVCPREVSAALLFSVGVNHALTTFAHASSSFASTLSVRATSPVRFTHWLGVGSKLGLAVLCTWAVMHSCRKVCTDRPCCMHVATRVQIRSLQR